MFWFIRKKKKKKISKQIIEQISTPADDDNREEIKELERDRRTPAEKAFAKIQESRQTQRILEKAQKKHKDRVNEFNSKLDTLTEHFDIPKVSWTKWRLHLCESLQMLLQWFQRDWIMGKSNEKRCSE